MTNFLAPEPPSDNKIIALVEREIKDDVLSLTTLRPGAWSSATAVSATSGEYVIRFAATPDDFKCDANAARFNSDNLPVPKIYGIGQLDERFWCISARMPGDFLDELTAKQMERTLPSLAQTLIAMREVDTSKTRGFGGWDHQGNGMFSSFAEQLMDVGKDVPDARGGGWTSVLDQHDYERRVFDEGMIDRKSTRLN